MNQSIKLSPNFYLDEMIESSTARRLKYTEQFNPTDSVIENLTNLCIKVLQPVRDVLPSGYIQVSSGYRCERLNDALKSKRTSFHLKGCAADISWITSGGIKRNDELFAIIKKMIESKSIPYTELIDEYNFAWVHVAYDPTSKIKRISKIE